MGSFFRDFFRLVGRYRRGLFLTFLLACFVFVAGVFLSYHLSTQTGTCDSCHFEKTYVESWKGSEHADVECHTCHTPLGFGGKMNRGLRAMATAWHYAWGTHSRVPRTEIDDRNCLQDGCHDTRLIEGPIEFVKGIEFDHADHLGDNIRGIDLRCTSCHSQIVQGAHMEVTEETCFLCHFKNLPRGQAISGCACHGPPEDLVIHEGFEFEHSQYITLGVVCEECHVNVTAGSGEVPRGVCQGCHNPRLEAYDNVGFMHRKHVVEHTVDCASCHEPMDHRDVELVRSLEASCTTCHTAPHNFSRDIFMGIGAKGVAPYPSIMFKAQVGCDGCHRESVHQTLGSGEVSSATAEACVMCHGKGFDNMLHEWRETIDLYLDRVAPLHRRASAAYRSAGASAKERVRKAMEEADYNVDFLARGHGEHNLVYTKLILIQVQEDLNDVLRGLRPSWRDETPLVFTESDLRGNCTMACHANLRKAKIVSFEGLELTHNDHVYKHNLSCTYCHDNSEVHGKVKLKRENCLGCHHTQENRECTDCHHLQKRMIGGIARFGVAEEPAIMADVDCSDCHTVLHGGNNRAATLQTCVDCHEEGYDEFVADWQDETRSRLAELREKDAEIRRLEVTARSRSVPTETIRAAEMLRTEARSFFDLIEKDRSGGAHNIDFAGTLLDAAEEKLGAAEAALTE